MDKTRRQALAAMGVATGAAAVLAQRHLMPLLKMNSLQLCLQRCRGSGKNLTRWRQGRERSTITTKKVAEVAEPGWGSSAL